MNNNSPAKWVPTLYFMEAIPYVAVNVMSVIMYKEMGLNNTQIAFYTSWLYLPWVIKPLWSPIVDAMATERRWILSMQSVCAVAMAGVALTLPTGFWLQATIAFLWLLAFSSATHDIAADGYYIIALDSNNQAKYVGIRSTFYRIGTIFGQGLLVMFAGWLKLGAPLWGGRKLFNDGLGVQAAWSLTFYLIAAITFALLIYHRIVLRNVSKKPENADDRQGHFGQVCLNTLRDFKTTLKVFFTKKKVWAALLFMLLFRFPEAQLGKIAQPFMIDSFDKGGMALSTEFVGFAYGTIGVFGLLLGGIAGGFLVARHGLKKWLWPMVIAISIPDAVYIYMSFTQTSNPWIIGSCVFIEQLGYGFGFTAYMMYLIYFARGENSTSVYALCTGIMALGMMLPGLIAGYLSDFLGYKIFFIWILLSCVVTFLVTAFLDIDSEFGKKTEKNVNNR